jgi:hypothetical protein
MSRYFLRSERLGFRLGFKYSHDELYPPTGLQHPSYFLTAEDYGAHARILAV